MSADGGASPASILIKIQVIRSITVLINGVRHE